MSVVSRKKDIFFDEYLLEENFYQKIDTLYRSVLKDSIYVRLPYYVTTTTEKDIAMRAADAADLIYEIRQARADMLTKTEWDHVSAEILSLVLDKLTTLENTLLQLFTGKKIQSSYLSRKHLFHQETTCS